MQMKTLTVLAASTTLALASIGLAQNPTGADPADGGAVNVPAAPATPVGPPISIGIDASPVSPAVAHQLRLPEGVGLVVDRVTYDSPAARAGIREYDVLQKLDGRLIDDPRRFVSLFATHRPGDSVMFTLIREGQPIDVRVTLGEPAAPVPADLPPNAGRAVPPRQHRSHGLRLPKINVRVDEHGDLVATDGSGHTLFRHSLDFTIDTPELPFSIHIEPKPGQPEAPPPDPQGR